MQFLKRRRKASLDPDLEAVEACKKGDTNAYELLVVKHQKQMFNIALRTIGHEEEAEEAVQEAFISAFKNIHKFKGSAQFSTWLTRIVINMSRNQIKKLSSEKREKTSVFSDLRGDRENGIEFDPVSTQPSPAARIEQKQVGKHVEFCLDQIESDFKEVLILKDKEGYSYDEIGETIEIPLGTVKSRLFRARDMMRNCLERKFGDLSHVMS